MLRRLALAMTGLMAVVATPHAAMAATATAVVSGKIVKPLTLTGGSTIALGTIVTPQTGTYSGTFTVQPASAQAGVYCPANFACSGTPTAAMFNIQGQNNTPLNINIPLTIVMTQSDYGGTGAAPTLTLNTTNSLFANNGSGNYVMTLPNSGAPGIDFWIGGALVVNQNSPGGTFAGTVNITADYQ